MIVAKVIKDYDCGTGKVCHKGDFIVLKTLLKCGDESEQFYMFQMNEGDSHYIPCENVEILIDWEQRRYEITKAAMGSLLTSFILTDDGEFAAAKAVKCADSLIAELKKGTHENNQN